MKETEMKTVMRLTLSMLLAATCYSQDSPESIPVEIFMEQSNVSPGNSITHTITAQGSIWDLDHNLTSNSGLLESSVTITGSNEELQNYGWDWLNTSGGPYPDYAYGLYKVTNTISGSYFYIDFRDSEFGAGYGGGQDILLRYNASTSTYSWCNNNPGPCELTSITNASTITIWDMKDVTGPNTAAFQPTDPTGLTVSTSGNPTLSWTRSEPRASAKYIVYRNSSAITSPAISDSFYVDSDYWISQSGSNLEYKVRAVSGDGTKYSSGYSNTVNTNAISTEKLADKSAHAVPVSGELVGAYPNPFNPQTTISFSLPHDTHLHLSVYDLLGRETVRLVDGDLRAGAHEAVWMGEDAHGGPVPSGMYLYRVETAGGTRQGKMLLVR